MTHLVPLITPSEPVSPDSADNVNGDLIVCAGSHIAGSDGRDYEVERHVGAGHFGQVYKVILTNSPDGLAREFAMKVSRSDENSLAQFSYETQVLSFLLESAFPPVRAFFHCGFPYRGHYCLIFDLLGPTLLEELSSRSFEGLSFGEIQSILSQVLTAVSGLSNLSLIHADIKPENILFRSQNPTSVSLIDYGSCCVVGDPNFSYIQSRYYRAPEVVLNSQIDTRADIWSVGCVAAELFLGLPLFPAISQLHLLVLMEEMLGFFPLEISRGSPYFLDDGSLKTLEVLEQETGESFAEFQPYFVEKGLDRIVMAIVEVGERDVSEEQARVFLDLLHKLLEFDPSQRISAEQALRHPFFALER